MVTFQIKKDDISDALFLCDWEFSVWMFSKCKEDDWFNFMDWLPPFLRSYQDWFQIVWFCRTQNISDHIRHPYYSENCHQWTCHRTEETSNKFTCFDDLLRRVDWKLCTDVFLSPLYLGLSWRMPELQPPATRMRFPLSPDLIYQFDFSFLSQLIDKCTKMWAPSSQWLSTKPLLNRRFDWYSRKYAV